MKLFNKKRINLPIIVSLLLMIVFCSGLLILNSSIGKNRELDEVRLNNNKGDSSMFAIMVEQADGTYDNAGNSWPTDGIRMYNEELSGCIDTDGNTIKDSLSYDKVNNKVILRTQQVLMCYLYFTYLSPDVIISVDNTKGTSQTGKYKRVIDCGGTANATFNPIYQRIEIGNVTSPTECTLNYIEDTKTYTTLISEVESKATEITDAVAVTDNSYFTLGEILDESDYIISTMGITADSSNAFIWDTTAKTWTSQNHTNSNTKSMEFTVSDNYYQLCYTMSSEQNYDYGIVYIDGVEKFNTKGNNTSSFICENLGNLTSSNVIKVSYRKDGSASSGNDNIVFYLQNGEYVENITSVTLDAGYRYTGKQPNNWVWFNGEKWRIIGSVPTTLSNGTETNLVKIIRSDMLGAFVFNSDDLNIKWGNNSLYTALNTKYYGKCVDQDGIVTSCLYKENGISNKSTDYYGRMLQDVYWNVGIVSSVDTMISMTLINESLEKSSLSGRVGLMNASDYGYATSGITYSSTKLSALSSYEQNNWLYGQGAREWTLTPNDIKSEMLEISITGSIINSTYASIEQVVRPVIYLDAAVFIISGDGSISNPYVIGI